MIRDDSKIYGEMNDPNTVLAGGTLTLNKFIVGSGNKGIQTFNPGPKNIIITDATGNATGFGYGTPNKRICTDASGNLVLLDPIIPYTFFRFGGSMNPAASISATNMGASPAPSVWNWLGVSGAKSQFADSSFTGRSCGTVTFSNLMTIPAGGRDVICEATYVGLCGGNMTLSIVSTGGTEYVINTGTSDINSQAGYSISTTINLPAGTYNRIKTQAMMIDKIAVGDISAVSCLCYWQ